MEQPASNPRRKRARRAYMILAIVAVVVAAVWGIHRWVSAGKEKTDDAQVDADVVPVSPRVSGVVGKVLVHDHQVVKAGDPLFELEPADLDIEVARATAERDAARAQAKAARAQYAIVKSSSKGGLTAAQAQVAGAGASVRSASDQIRAARAAVAKAKADLATADTELARTKDLVAKGAVTLTELEKATQTRDVAKAGLDAANAQLDVATAQQGMASSRVAEAQGHVAGMDVDAQVEAAEAAQELAEAREKAAGVALDKAKLQRTYATIKAPIDGYVSRIAAHTGQTIQMSQPIVMLVPAETYVIANFKEGQINRMKAGDEVDVTIDAFPGEEFSGVVDTVSPATGARFSMIPPDNATGNFVKVVQRVPVKITWKTKPDIVMRPGLSAEVTVHVK